MPLAPLKKKAYVGLRQPGDDEASRRQLSGQLSLANSNSQGKNTNAVFAASDVAFRELCELNDVDPTSRQASKFRNNRGAAYKASQGWSVEKLRPGSTKGGKRGKTAATVSLRVTR